MQPKFQISILRILVLIIPKVTNLFLNNLNYLLVELDFYKIIIPILKIQLIKEEFLVKIVFFNNKILVPSFRVNLKSNQFKKVKIQNKIINKLVTKII